MSQPGTHADPQEIERTRPDRILYDPTGGRSQAWDDTTFLWLNEHVLVQEMDSASLLATWTSEHIGAEVWLQRVMASTSRDGGRTWTEPVCVDGSGIDGGLEAAWQVPVVAHGGHIYLFYTYGNRGWFASGLRCRTSDDHGRTWSAPADLPTFPKTAIDSPDPKKTPVWICCSGPHRDSRGRVLIPYTRWAQNPAIPAGVGDPRDLYSHIEVLCLENLVESPDPRDMVFRWLNLDSPVTAPHPKVPGASIAQEPYLANLPDGRLFISLRTNLGQVWYSVSDDGGTTWRKAEPMRDRDGGRILQQPSAPCPVFGLVRGDFVMLFNNNDGTAFGAPHVWDVANRRPAYLARGEFRADAHQPIWWSAPRLLIDNDAVAWGPPGRGRLEAAAYCSLTEHQDQRILWYPDRKGFLLGRILPDSFLDSLAVPVDDVRK